MNIEKREPKQNYLGSFYFKSKDNSIKYQNTAIGEN